MFWVIYNIFQPHTDPQIAMEFAHNLMSSKKQSSRLKIQLFKDLKQQKAELNEVHCAPTKAELTRKNRPDCVDLLLASGETAAAAQLSHQALHATSLQHQSSLQASQQSEQSLQAQLRHLEQTLK